MNEVATIADWAALTVREMTLPAVRSKEVANFALVALAGAQIVNRAILGYAPTYRALVDGRAGAALDTVNPDGGKIEFEFAIIDDVLRWIMSTLRERSPVRSGDYQKGHILLADGVAVDVDARIPAAREYVLTNSVPYARKIEIGTTKSGRPFVIQVSPRIYETVATMARNEFSGRNLKIGFELRPLNFQGVGSWSRSASAHRLAARNRGGAARQHVEWLTRQPAIIVQGI